jgi:outer membrane protein assembly factor BamB
MQGGVHMSSVHRPAVLTCLVVAIALCGASAAAAATPTAVGAPSAVRDARAAGLADTAWPMARGGVRHTGRSPYRGPARAARKWTFYPRRGVEDGFISSAVIGRDGTAYVGCHNGFLYAIRSDGRKKWQLRLTVEQTDASPAIAADGTIYAVSFGTLFAVSPGGKKLWQLGEPENLGFWNRSAPAVGSDGTIYVGGADIYPGQACLVAVNPDGKVRWRFMVPWGPSYVEDTVNSSPAIGRDGTIYVGTTDYHLYAVTPGGQQEWSLDTGGRIADEAPAIGSDGTIYVTAGDGGHLYGHPDQVSGRLLAVSPAGAVLWSVPTDKRTDSAPAIARDGTIYVNATTERGGHLIAITPKGKSKWKFTVPGMAWGSPTVGADGLIYTCGFKAIYCVTPKGKKKWSWTTRSMVTSGGGSPVIDKRGTLYFGSNDSYYALKR